MMLKIVLPNRELDLFKAVRLKESVGRREYHIVIFVFFKPGFKIFYAPSCRAAAVVAYAVENHHAVIFLGHQLFGKIARSANIFGTVRAVSALGGYSESRYPSAVKALPREHIGYLGVLMRSGTHHNICVHASFFYELRKHSAVAERVHVICSFAYPAEFFVVVELRIERLAGKALRRGNVAVRLNPPAVYGYPTPLLYSLPYLLKHIGGYLLDPLVIRRGRAGEYEIRILIEPVERTAEGLKHLSAALLPAP